jgi:hypothetical protein
MKKGIKILAGVMLIIVLTFSMTGCAGLTRMGKSIGSDLTGGLDRVVTVYDQNGNVLQTYEGKIDIEDTDYGNKISFDLNGKRIVIYNSTVIVEEK